MSNKHKYRIPQLLSGACMTCETLDCHTGLATLATPIINQWNAAHQSAKTNISNLQ